MKLTKTHSLIRRGFTLIEVLAAVTIIGIMVFLAIPNITAIRTDAEENMAISKASMLNMALSAYIQSVGIATAKSDFQTIANGTSTTKNALRFDKIRPYLAYSTSTIEGFMPSDYDAILPASLDPLTKTLLNKPDGNPIHY